MVEYQGSQAMHCEQPQVDHKEQQLQSLRDNAVKCLTIVLVSDLDYITDLVHVLMYNTSVKHLALVSAARQDYDAYPTNDAEWVLLLKGFQSRALGERIESLLLQDQDVPFCMIPNALWQFRSLRSLVICKSACDSWEEDHWQVFSIAIRAHSSLQKLKMEQTSNGNAMGAPIDTLALAVATSLTLREYIHVGPRDPLSKSCTQHQQLSVDSMAALVRSTTLHNLTYHRSGLYSTKSSIGLIDALKMTTLLQLSISGNKIDFAAHGVQVCVAALIPDCFPILSTSWLLTSVCITLVNRRTRR